MSTNEMAIQFSVLESFRESKQHLLNAVEEPSQDLANALKEIVMQKERDNDPAGMLRASNQALIIKNCMEKGTNQFFEQLELSSGVIKFIQELNDFRAEIKKTVAEEVQLRESELIRQFGRCSLETAKNFLTDHQHLISDKTVMGLYDWCIELAKAGNEETLLEKVSFNHTCMKNIIRLTSNSSNQDKASVITEFYSQMNTYDELSLGFLNRLYMDQQSFILQVKRNANQSPLWKHFRYHYSLLESAEALKRK